MESVIFEERRSQADALSDPGVPNEQAVQVPGIHKIKKNLGLGVEWWRGTQAYSRIINQPCPVGLGRFHRPLPHLVLHERDQSGSDQAQSFLPGVGFDGHLQPYVNKDNST